MKKKILSAIIICVIFILLQVINIRYKKYTDINERKKIENVIKEEPNANKQIEVLRKEYDNEDIKAVIKSDALELECIVSQTSNNEFYMNHNEKKDYEIKGSAFFDYRNRYESKRLIIYGHNSKTLKTNFGKLAKYLNEDFTKNNPYIYLTTDEGITKWKIFSIMIVPNNTTKHTKIEFTTANELEENVSWMKQNSIIEFNEDIGLNDQLLTLQTCYYEPENSFLLVNFKKVEDNNE